MGRQVPLPGLVREVTRDHINDDKKPSSGGEKASRGGTSKDKGPEAGRSWCEAGAEGKRTGVAS